MEKTAVSIKNLTKIYRQGLTRKSHKAVDQLSLSIEQGSVMGLIGPNGAGKTTTIYCILGLLIPDLGSISIFGKNPQDKEARRRMGYQSEVFHTYDFLKPKAALQFYGRLSGMNGDILTKEIDFQLSRLGLNHARDRKVGSFSKGMKQRLGVAQALLHDPNLLILDEPFTGLDPEGRNLVGNIILEEKNKGKTVFFSSHVLADIERLCDQVAMIRNGEVVLNGGIQDVTANDNRWIIEVTGLDKSHFSTFENLIYDLKNKEAAAEISCPSDNKEQVLRILLDLPAEIIGIHPKTQSLDELYMEIDEEEIHHA